jgi:hypothetical protein
MPFPRKLTKPKLYDYDGDLNRTWFIAYYVPIGNNGLVGKKMKTTTLINNFNTVEERIKAADLVIEEINRQIFNNEKKIDLSKLKPVKSHTNKPKNSFSNKEKKEENRNKPKIVEEITELIQKSLLEIAKYKFELEDQIQEFLADYLENNTEHSIHREYNIGGMLASKIDIDVNEGQVGIELKMVRAIGSAEHIYKFMGQVLYYSRRLYNNNTIIIICGNKKQINRPIIRELKKFFEEFKFLVFLAEI